MGFKTRFKVIVIISLSSFYLFFQPVAMVEGTVCYHYFVIALPHTDKTQLCVPLVLLCLSKLCSANCPHSFRGGECLIRCTLLYKQIPFVPSWLSCLFCKIKNTLVSVVPPPLFNHAFHSRQLFFITSFQVYFFLQMDKNLFFSWLLF